MHSYSSCFRLFFTNFRHLSPLISIVCAAFLASVAASQTAPGVTGGLLPLPGCTCGAYEPHPGGDRHFQQSMKLTGGLKYAEALKEAELAVKAAPDEHAYRNQLAVAQFNVDQVDKAVATWKELEKSASSGCEMSFYLNALCRLQRWQDAIALAPRAIADCPTSVDPYILKAQALQGLGRFDEALVAAQSAVAIDPASSAVQYQQASCYFTLKKYQEAIASANESIRLDPKDAAGFGLASMSHAKSEKYEDALKAAQKAMALSKDPVYARQAGDALAALKRYQDAVTEYTKALASGFDAAALYGRATALHELGDDAAALKDLEVIQTQVPGFRNVSEWIAAIGNRGKR